MNAPIQHPYCRPHESLNGLWRAIIDPYQTGYRDIFGNVLRHGFFQNRRARDESERIEYDFETSPTLCVPGDWNSQNSQLLYYEGSVWYARSFSLTHRPGTRSFLWFGAANYEAHVWLDGEKLGAHTGGFTPLSFEISDRRAASDHSLVVMVDNRRRSDGVPGLQTDWWNYGGITRDVLLVQTPETFVRDWRIELMPGSRTRLRGFVQLDGPGRASPVRLRIADAGVDVQLEPDESGRAALALDAALELWSPERPRMYDVEITLGEDRIADRIGFRTVTTDGSRILLNEEPIFLRGISIHEEAPMRGGRAHGPDDARVLLGWARELGCNFVRLSHYPHDEHTVRAADESGLLVWAELPVYWQIDWTNNETLANARAQLEELIARDANRASVVFWSVGNEAPHSEPRSRFLRELATLARELDDTRLVTAALLTLPTRGKQMHIDDPIGADLDVLAVNEYFGWYYFLPPEIDDVAWTSAWDKPLIVSELGADARQGHHGRPTQRWTEEFQVDFYEHQIEMLRKIPFLAGLSPWILCDFRSPRRLLPGIQDGWNRKGLVSERGEKKAAFETLRRFYAELARGPR
jgi:beta-glucuronidase